MIGPCAEVPLPRFSVVLKVALVVFAAGLVTGWHALLPQPIDFYTEDFASSASALRLQEDLEARYIARRILSGPSSRWES